MEPLQQLQRPLGLALGEQHPGQHQVLALAGIAEPIVAPQPALLGPAGGVGDLTLGQQQPRSQRRHGVEQANRRRARLDPLGLPHRGGGAVRVALGRRIQARMARPVASGGV